MIRRRPVVAAALVVVSLAARTGAQCEVAHLVPPGIPAESYGVDVDLQGSTALVGLINPIWGTTPSWVFELQAGTWTSGSALPPETFMTSYGDSVGVWGDTAVIAGQQDNDPGVGATVFEQVGGAWVQSTKLYVPDPIPQLSQGLSVDIEGDTIVVADWHLHSVFVFERTAGVWSMVQTLSPGGPPFDSIFGTTVSLQGNRVVVGGFGIPETANLGKAWVFVRPPGGAFVQVAQLVPVGGQDDDNAGSEVAQSGDRIVLGAPNHGLGFPVTGIGAAFVFERVGGTWTQTAVITAPFPQLGDYFGTSVALQGDLLLVGAPREDTPFTDSGAVYAYRRNGTAWQHIATIQASAPAAHEQFGTALALDGDTLLVGVLAGSMRSQGRAYVLRGLQGLVDWIPVGGGVAGGGAPCTFGTGTPSVGASAQVTLVGALPGKPGWLVLGLDRINVPFKGGIMVPAPQLLVPLLTDATGSKVFGWTWPPGLPPGLVLSLQHWIADAGAPDGLAGADALSVKVP